MGNEKTIGEDKQREQDEADGPPLQLEKDMFVVSFLSNSIGGVYRKGSTELPTLFVYLPHTHKLKLPLALLTEGAFLFFSLLFGPKKMCVTPTSSFSRQGTHHTLTSSYPKGREGLCEKRSVEAGNITTKHTLLVPMFVSQQTHKQTDDTRR